jgi:hypothetical protein
MMPARLRALLRGVPVHRLTSAQVPLGAALVAYAGLLPFVAGALGVWLAPPYYAFALLLIELYYAAVILAFLGAVHWGLALAGYQPLDYHATEETRGMHGARLGWSVMPALAAWVVCLLADLALAFAVLILAHVVLYFGERLAARAQLVPDWYMEMRLPLTAIGVACMAVTLAALLV